MYLLKSNSLTDEISSANWINKVELADDVQITSI